jgi:hypothetical protein
MSELKRVNLEPMTYRDGQPVYIKDGLLCIKLYRYPMKTLDVTAMEFIITLENAKELLKDLLDELDGL